VVELLSDDAQLLAIADAVALTQRRATSGVRTSEAASWRSQLRRRLATRRRRTPN